MTKCTPILLVALVSIFSTPSAFASINYEFCVDRVSSAANEKFGARYKFGDIDPGKEVARVLVSQKYKQADTTSVGVTDYNQANCGPIREEANVTMTSDQLKALGAAIGRGDIPGTATVAVEVVSGITVKTVQETGKAAGGAAHWIGCRLGIGC